MKKIFFLTFLCCGLLACGPKITSEQVRQLDELEAGVDSAVALLMNEIDSTTVFNLTNSFFKDREFFQNEMNDTLDTKTIFFIDKYMGYKKSMQFLQLNYRSIAKESLIMQKQIKDLRHDVENRLVDESRFVKYYELEFSNFTQLQEASKQIGNIYNKSSAELAEMRPKIDSIVTAYKSKIVE